MKLIKFETKTYPSSISDEQRTSWNHQRQFSHLYSRTCGRARWGYGCLSGTLQRRELLWARTGSKIRYLLYRIIWILARNKSNVIFSWWIEKSDGIGNYSPFTCQDRISIHNFLNSSNPSFPERSTSIMAIILRHTSLENPPCSCVSIKVQLNKAKISLNILEWSLKNFFFRFSTLKNFFNYFNS